MTLYKAVRPDGTSFHDPGFRWVPETGEPTGTVVTHPAFSATGEADGYLSVSTEPGDCTGMSWPCRLLTVEPVGEVLPDPRGGYPHKRIGAAFRVTGERPAHEALGPQGEQVAAFLALLPTLTSGQWDAARAAAWVAAWDAAARDAAARDAARAATGAAALAAARDAARAAALAATGDAARDAAGDAAWDAALALAVRDLITPKDFATLTAPMRAGGMDFDHLTGDPS